MLSVIAALILVFSFTTNKTSNVSINVNKIEKVANTWTPNLYGIVVNGYERGDLAVEAWFDATFPDDVNLTLDVLIFTIGDHTPHWVTVTLELKRFPSEDGDYGFGSVCYRLDDTTAINAGASYWNQYRNVSYISFP